MTDDRGSLEHPIGAELRGGTCATHPIVIEEIGTGQRLARPVRRVAGIAVVANPLAGGVVEDLSPLFDPDVRGIQEPAAVLTSASSGGERFADHLAYTQATTIGESPPRLGGERFVTGAGRFVDEVRVAGMLHAAVLRSPHAHARLVSIDAEGACDLRGVHSVLTRADVPANAIIPNRVPAPGGAGRYLQPAIARDVVRY